MRDREKIKDQLVNELVGLRQRVAELELLATEHKQVEEVLRESEEKYRNLVERANDGIVIIQNKIIKYVNPRLTEMWGGTAEEITGTPFTDYIYPDELPKVIDRYKRRMEGETLTQIYETILLQKDGGKAYVELNADIITYQGKPADLVFVRNTTERKRAEKELMESEEKYRNLVERANDGIMIIQGKEIKYVNPHLVEMWGGTAEEITGTPFTDYIYPNELPKVIDRFKRRMEGETLTMIFETVLRRKDGSKVYAELNSGIITYQGELSDLVIVRDTTERKRAEEILRKSEEKYRTLIKNINVGVYRNKGPKGKFIEANPAIVKMFGYESREEFLTIDVTDLYRNPKDRKKFNEKMLRDGFVRSQEIRLKKKDGIPFIGSVSVVIVKDKKGEVKYYDGIIEDITERKQAEEALRESEEKYRFLVDNSREIILIISKRGKILFANRIALTGFGYHEDELIGKSITRVLTKDSTMKALYSLAQEFLGRPQPEIELRLKAKSGEIRCFKFAQGSTPVHKNGKLVGIMVSAQDITERKRAEKELKKYHEHLEELVKKRTNELKKKTIELEQANIRLNEADCLKSEFLASMSHELRTPLNAIIGFSEILADKTFGELNNKQSKYINNVLISGRHLLQLINDILDLSKIEAGKMELETSKININSLLENSMIMIKEKAMKHGVKPNLNINQEILGLNILADERKFKQIIFNLLSNAVKFTPDGGSITTSAYREGKDLFISVSDTGIGIKPEDQERIFGKFEQVDSSYARQQRGTGLGLALTSQLVKLHGGRIWVKSEGEGKGSTFTFVIPIKTEEQKIEVQTEPEKLLTSQPKVDDSHSLILVVEDDRQASELISHYLSEAGYAVANAFDGAQAIEMARKLKPCAITLDIILPKKNGWDVLTELKSLPETVDIPVVIVSVVESRLFGLNLGAIEYFIKPLNKDKLIEVMQNVTNKTGKETKDITVLIIDDEPKTMDLLTDMLQLQGFDVLQAYGGQEGIDLAIKKHPDVIILDLMMPDVSGFDVAQQLRANFEAMEIPILVYTAKDLTEEDRQKLEGNVQAIALKSGSGKEALLKELKKLIKIKSGK